MDLAARSGERLRIQRWTPHAWKAEIGVPHRRYRIWDVRLRPSPDGSSLFQGSLGMSPNRAMADLPRVVLLTGLFSPVWALYLYFPAFRTRRVLVFLGVTTTVMVASFYLPTLVGWVVRVVV